MSATATPDIDIDLEEDLEKKISFYKQYVLIVHNDDDHTFDYVVETFMKTLKYTIEQCVKLAYRIHTEQLAIVFSGMLEHVEFKQDQIRSCGPDLYNPAKTVTYPLLTEIREV